MKFILLQSGSAGNCTLIQSKKANILIDIGLSERNIANRLKVLGLSMDDIDGVFITHEHSDHIKGIDMVDGSKLFGTKETLQDFICFNPIEQYKMFEFKDLKILPIPISHDIRKGVGYLIDDGYESLLYLTDTGFVKKTIQPILEDCDHYIIEANHNEDMVMRSSRPMFLKKRILSRHGHMSNKQCGELLANVIGPHTKTIVLSHISGVCNTPELCYEEVTSVLKESGKNLEGIEIKCADRAHITFGRKEYEESI